MFQKRPLNKVNGAVQLDPSSSLATSTMSFRPDRLQRRYNRPPETKARPSSSLTDPTSRQVFPPSSLTQNSVLSERSGSPSARRRRQRTPGCRGYPSPAEKIRQICQNLGKYPSNSPQFQSKFRTGGLEQLRQLCHELGADLGRLPQRLLLLAHGGLSKKR